VRLLPFFLSFSLSLTLSPCGFLLASPTRSPRRVSYGVRFFYLVNEGLLLHPLLHLVDSPSAADIVLYLPESAAWERSECNKPEYASKLVVLDESDGPHVMRREGVWNLLYFKRSYVERHHGVSRCLSHTLTLSPPPLPLSSSRATWTMSQSPP
jgi:hypothetical protein